MPCRRSNAGAGSTGAAIYGLVLTCPSRSERCPARRAVAAGMDHDDS